jgi:hypothetical protein
MKTRLLCALVLIAVVIAGCTTQPSSVTTSPREGRTVVTAAHFDLIYTEKLPTGDGLIPATGTGVSESQTQAKCSYHSYVGRAFYLRCTPVEPAQ